MKLVRGILRMQDLRLPEQQLRLGEICRLPRFRRAAIDMTGLGLGCSSTRRRSLAGRASRGLISPARCRRRGRWRRRGGSGRRCG